MAPGPFNLPSKQERPTERQSYDWKEIEEDDNNMLIRLGWGQQKKDFLHYLGTEISTIETIVAQHLGLAAHQQCRVNDRSQWICGTYNVCIPVDVSNWHTRRVLMRCPLPHRFGGLDIPTLMEEKTRCEAASFAWITANCRHVPIPRLWGFGLPNGLCFSPREYAPWYLRALGFIKRCWAYIFGRPSFFPFVPLRRYTTLKSGYLLMDFIDKRQGEMLSAKPLPSEEQRQTFLRSLSRILVDLSRPLSKIGSFTVHDSGEVTLSNRPLTRGLVGLENEGVPTTIGRDTCYFSTDTYLQDLLSCHVQRLIYQPNAARDKDDIEGQMATVIMLRALLPNFIHRRFRQGPFLFTLTDLHESNILVNERYQITCLVDLEWSCSLPIDMQHPPYWLGGDCFDDLYGEGTEEKQAKFERRSEEFLKILEQEEYQPSSSSFSPPAYAQSMRDSLKSKSHWYMSAVRIPHAAYNLFVDCLQPQFAPSHLYGDGAARFQDVVARYWGVDSATFTQQKVQDKEDYDRQLRSRIAM